MNGPLRLIVIDDHPLVHQGVAAIVGTTNEFALVGSALNADDGLKVLEMKPDIALVDLRLGKASGLSLIQRGRLLAPECRFVLFTSGLERYEVRDALDLGVAGFVLKEAGPAEMVTAIQQVASGRRYVDPAVMEVVLAVQEPVGTVQEPLTERQKEVLTALGRGLGTHQIAAMFQISESTVKKHISEILAKLQLTDRTQAALYAVAHGLVELDTLDFASTN